MVIRVDLATRILSNEHKVFLARPGRESRLYAAFLQANVIGPELPGIILTPGTPISAQPDLETMLKKAIAIRTWADNGKPDDQYPSERLSDYKRRRKVKGAPQFRSILTGYFEAAKQGDLLIIPPSAYSGDVVLAEFSQDEAQVRNITIERYGEFSLPTRPIVQLASIQKRKLPIPLLDLISKPVAFVQIGREHYSYLYNLAYGSYVTPGEYNTKISITKEVYNTDDDLFLLSFLNFVAANTRNVSIREEGGVVPIERVLFETLGEFAPALRTNVNSPGYLGLNSPYITPLVTAVMLALALHIGAEAASAAEAGKIIIGNSKSGPDDPCTAAVAESVLTQMKLYGLDKWPEACEIAKKAAEETGLKAGPTVTKK